MMKHRSYSELLEISTFEERYAYLKLIGMVGSETFGVNRYLNQLLYRSKRWRSLRDQMIIRDAACDLAMPDHEIVGGHIVVHHINPIRLEDLEEENQIVFDPNNLICTTHETHMAIHYGDESLLTKPLIVRRPGDTTPWR